VESVSNVVPQVPSLARDTKKLCQDYHEQDSFEIAERMGRKGYIGIDPSCSFYTMKVPCKLMMPRNVLDKKGKEFQSSIDP
jgi:hypothetical protein